MKLYASYKGFLDKYWIRSITFSNGEDSLCLSFKLNAGKADKYGFFNSVSSREVVNMTTLDFEIGDNKETKQFIKDSYISNMSIVNTSEYPTLDYIRISDIVLKIGKIFRKPFNISHATRIELKPSYDIKD